MVSAAEASTFFPKNATGIQVTQLAGFNWSWFRDSSGLAEKRQRPTEHRNAKYFAKVIQTLMTHEGRGREWTPPSFTCVLFDKLRWRKIPANSTDEVVMFRTLATRLRQYGPLETAFLGLRWAGLLDEVHSLEFFIRDFEPQVSQPVGPMPDSAVVCAELLVSDLPHAKLADGLPTKVWAEQQFARGSRLFAASHGDLTVAWCWFNTRAADLTFIRKPAVPLPGGFAYIHGVIVDPSYRGRGIGGLVKAFGCSRLADEGVRHVVAAVFLWNARAIDWHGRVLRERHWGRITHVRVNRADHWLKFLAAAGREEPNLFDAIAHH